MRIVLDANLSPKLVPDLAQAGHHVVHIADLGTLTAVRSRRCRGGSGTVGRLPRERFG